MMEFNFLDILLLPIIFFIGIITSIDDIRIGKIKNKWILFGIIYGIIIYTILIFWNELTFPISFVWEKLFNFDPISVINIRDGFLWKLAVNSFLSLVFGFFLWRSNVVAAGDVKLFFLFSFLLPTKYYWKSYLPIFPSFSLLVNIFIIILIFILSRSLFCLFLKTKENGFKNLFKNKIKKDKKLQRNEIKNSFLQIIGMISIFLLFFWFRYYLKKIFNFDAGTYQYLLLVLMILFSRKIIGILSKNNNFLLILVVSLNLFITIIGLFIDFDATVNNVFMTLRMMTFFIVLMTLFAKFINYYVKETGIHIIEIDNLSSRMMINSINTKQLNKNKKFVKKYGRIISGGITKEQVRAVIKWAKNRDMETIEIYKKFSLAPWIFVGVISIVILKKSFINILLDFIK